MAPGYEYHVFISYRRSGDVGEWVHNHFHPMLLRRLESLLDEEPKVFLDTAMENGSHWPQRLSDALHRSCCLAAVWTPSYFRSDWCLAEWRTIAERERLVGLPTPAGRPGLVYPVVFSDGEHFPDDAKAIQARQNMHEFAYPYEQFRKTEKYLEFHDRMNEVATDLLHRLRGVPQWDSAWPVLPPLLTPPPATSPSFVRL